LDVSQQVEQVRDEIESLHSSVMSRHEGKHQCYIAKLEAKSEHNRDLKKIRLALHHPGAQSLPSCSQPSAPAGGERHRNLAS
jgi:hypothetical protein